MVSVDSWWDGLVRDRAQAILELVLRSIADDYESLEIILETINKWFVGPEMEPWPALSVIPVSEPEVIKALQELTREGYAQSCILDGCDYHAGPVDIRGENVSRLWFCVTAKGLRAVQHLNGEAVGNS